MSNLISINASVVSCTGRLNTYNDDSFFINGRYKFEYELDNIQVSIENEDDAHLFAVFDGLKGQSSSFSINQEMERIYENMEDDMTDTLSKVKGCFQQAINLSSDMQKINYGCSCLIITNGKAVAVSSGENRAFLYRKGVFKSLTADYAKAGRLLKFGIITDEQAKALSKQTGPEDVKGLNCSEVINLKKGDIILLISDGLGASIDDDRIHEIISMGRETWFTSNMLVSEAIKNGGEDNTTALVVKVDDIDEEDTYAYEEDNESLDEVKKEKERIMRRPKYRFNKQKALSTLISVTTILVIIAGMFLTIFKIWQIKYREDIPPDVSPTPQETGQTTPTTTPEPTPETSHTTAPGTTSSPAATPTPTPKPSVQPTPTTGQQTTYTVVEGDTLFRIASKFYNSRLMEKVEDIKKANNLTNDTIIPGQKLIIPNPEKTE